MAAAPIIWRRESEWGERTIQATPRGYLVRQDIRIQGERTGMAVLIRYSAEWPAGIDSLDEANDWGWAPGDNLCEHARAALQAERYGVPPGDYHIISRGHLVR